MKKFVLAFMLLLLLAGCDAAKLTGAKQEESSLPDISSVAGSISRREPAPLPIYRRNPLSRHLPGPLFHPLPKRWKRPMEEKKDMMPPRR